MTDYTDIRQALAKARDWLNKYATSRYNEQSPLDARDLADECDAAINTLPALLADAERWRMIAEPSEAVVEVVARRIYEADRSEKMGCRRTEDFWINVWDAEPDGSLQLLAYRHAEIALLAIRNLTPDTPAGETR